MNHEKLKAVNSIIERRKEGTAQYLANYLSISKSMFHRYINYMRTEMKAPIEYNKRKKCYEYTRDGELGMDGWKSGSGRNVR